MWTQASNFRPLASQRTQCSDLESIGLTVLNDYTREQLITTDKVQFAVISIQWPSIFEDHNVVAVDVVEFFNMLGRLVKCYQLPT